MQHEAVIESLIFSIKRNIDLRAVIATDSWPGAQFLKYDEMSPLRGHGISTMRTAATSHPSSSGEAPEWLDSRSSQLGSCHHGRNFSPSINKTPGLLDITGTDQIPISTAGVKGAPSRLGMKGMESRIVRSSASRETCTRSWAKDKAY